MKKILIACLSLAAMLTSCSDDDSTPTGNNSPLVSTKQTLYENGEVEEIFVSEYSNGKITKMNWLTPENVQTGYNIISYNSDGLLSSINTYMGTAVYSTTEYTYDNQGRMTTVHQLSEPEGVDYTRTFTHNNDNTITSTSTNSWEEPKTFYLNSNNVAYKEVSENYTYELTFDGNTVVSTSYNGVTTTTYEYDEEHDPSLLNIDPGTGNFKPNNSLRLNRLSGSSDKYKIKAIEDNVVTKYIYTFNEQGLPTKSMTYYNDVLISQMEYFYN